MANLSIFRHRFYKNDGTLNAGGKVYTYVPGTSTLRNTYTDSTAGTPNTNPIILDSKGEAAIWQTGKIKVNVLESDDTQVTGFPVDDIGYLIIADDIHAATNKTTPVDADEIGIWDSISEVLNRVTFANLWAYIQSKLAAPGAIGGTTPAAGSFTTLTSSGGGSLVSSTITATGTISSTKQGTTTNSAIVANPSIGGSSITGIYSTADAAAGTAIAVHGVAGTTALGIGVKGEGDTGLYGIGSSLGVSGFCAGTNNNDTGIYGESTNGYGMVAKSDTTSPLTSAFRIVPQDTQPTTGQVGDMYVTTAGVLKICTVAGTPGTWVSVGAQ